MRRVKTSKPKDLKKKLLMEDVFAFHLHGSTSAQYHVAPAGPLWKRAPYKPLPLITAAGARCSVSPLQVEALCCSLCVIPS